MRFWEKCRRLLAQNWLLGLGLVALSLWRLRRRPLEPESPAAEAQPQAAPAAPVAPETEELQELQAPATPAPAVPLTAPRAAKSPVAVATPMERPRRDTGLARGFLNAPKKKEKDKTKETREKENALAKTKASTESIPAQEKQASELLQHAEHASAAAIAREQEAGVRHFHACAFRDARDAFRRMKAMAAEAQMGREEGQACRLLGNALDKLNAPDEEIDAAYREAMRLAHKNNDMQLSFNVLTGMGSHEVRKENLDEAEHLYFQSLMLAKRVLTSHEEAIAEGNLGMCLGQIEGRRAECLEHFRRAVKLHDGSNSHSVVTLLANYASALCADDQYAEAQKEYEAALALARKIGDRRVEVNILTNLANLCENILSMPEKARSYRQALRVHDGKEPCAICLDSLDNGSPQIVLQCNHIYHSDCFERVLASETASRSRCPQCRNSHSSFAAA